MLDKKSYDDLVLELQRYAYHYYVLDKPLVDDYYYDRLYQSLIEFEQAYPLLVDSCSPSQRIGAEPLNSFNQVTHHHVMASLSNAFDTINLQDFVDRIKKMMNSQDMPVLTVEPKVDGVAVSLIYKKGRLVQASTRGNGYVGEDITHNIKTILSLPLILSEPLDLELRGEVYMSKSVFKSLSNQFVNPRNAAAGSLRQLDSRIAAKRKLEIMIYQLIGSPYDTHFESIKYAQSLGFPVLSYIKRVTCFEQLIDCIKEIQDVRQSLSWDMDGAVIKIDEYKLQNQLGYTSKAPRWAIAYKYPEERVETIVDDIVVQVGRTGVLTPVAYLKPVLLAGVTVKRASLHNFDEIKRLNISIGDKVWIQRSGEVIPKVVALSQSFEKGKSFVIPEYCASCGSEIKKDIETISYRCIGNKCPEKIKAQFTHFVSKKGMNIEGFGVKLVDQLFDKGYVNNLSDCYYLSFDQLITLEGFATKSATLLLTAIEKSRDTRFSAFLFALGIPYVGQQAANLLAKNFVTLKGLMMASREAMLEVSGIGVKTVDSLIAYFQNEDNLQMLNVFQALEIPKPEQTTATQGVLSDKTFVITGTFKTQSREEIKKRIEKLGGRVLNQVSKSLSVLLVGEKPGSKLKKALSLNEKKQTIKIVYQLDDIFA